MKKIICLMMALCLMISAAAALADEKEINGGEERNIQINPAGDNPVEEGVSPTTGRLLSEVAAEAPEGSAGLAVTGRYMPIMAQIQNYNQGIGYYAPLYGACADVIYETSITYNGDASRLSMVFSDVIPPYGGFCRSTRVTHVLLRQEWDSAFVTSGWSEASVPDEMKRLGHRDPTNAIMTAEDPGLFYPAGTTTRPWSAYDRRLVGGNVTAAPNNVVFELAAIINNVVPQDYLPRSHAFRFTDEKPEGEDAGFIHVTMTSDNGTYSELEYDEETNTYFRYTYQNGTPVTYSEQIPVNMQKVKIDGEDRFRCDRLEKGREIDFSNVIIQSVDYEWRGFENPFPKLVGTGNADYFMGGKHIAGVWQRTDDNSRTVFYGPDGNEIELQRGRTLIVLLDWKTTGHASYE